MMKRNDGFTLVELMVSIAIASLITMAALSTMLLGLRINQQTSINAKQQNATNMLMQVIQKVSEEPNITTPPENENKISICSNDTVIIEWDRVAKAIYMGNSTTPYMENVLSFETDINKNNLLTLTIKVGETEDKYNEYTASVYCRLNETPDQGGNAE